MKKRVLSLIIALLLMFSCILASAEVVNPQTDNSYVYVENKLYFEPDTAGWKNYEKIFCHIWEYETGEQFFSWQSKGEACVNKDGKWYYDLDMKAVSLEKGVLYACIFSNENGQQTYELLFNFTVLGDSAYCNGTYYDSPDDSSRKIHYAYWRNQNKTKFGPVMQITGWGTVVGTCVPGSKTKLSLFADFLTSTTFSNAQIFSGLNDQDLLDHIGRQLGLKATDVKTAISSTGVEVEWNIDDSKLYRIGWDDPDIYTVDEAVTEYEILNETEVETNRYYFLMPNGKNGDLGDDDSVDEYGNPLGHYGEYSESWLTMSESGNLMTNTACIYWWDSGVADPPKWVGYLPSGSEADDPCVFYADVPKAVTTIIWNNGVDIGLDPEKEVYYLGRQTMNLQCEGYAAGESDLYPDGLDSFDNMIYVLDPDKVYTWETIEFGGEWYYYYGSGCYGTKKDGTIFDCLRFDHMDANGNHVGHNQYGGMTGDVDGDDYINITDATLIQRYIAQLDEFNEYQKNVADVDKDGNIAVIDATKIQMHLAGY